MLAFGKSIIHQLLIAGYRYPHIWIAFVIATRSNARLLGLEISANLSNSTCSTQVDVM